MELFTYFRSSAAYRVRIALALKQVPHQLTPVNLARDEQRASAFLQANPQGLVPALKLDSGEIIAQSGAILEWLEESYPTPPLYAATPTLRAQQRALCQHIACDIHPLNNLRVLRYLKATLDQEQDSVDRWYAHWICRGFEGLENAVAEFEGYSMGDHPGMFEVMLVPQIYNARRFRVDLSAFPSLCALDARCALLEPFASAHPERQPDANPG